MNDCSNRTGEYLKAHAEIEHESALPQQYVDEYQRFERAWTIFMANLAVRCIKDGVKIPVPNEAEKSYAKGFFLMGFEEGGRPR